MPIFWKGELIAWAEVGGHQGECGSISPGGFSPRAKTRWEEGLHVHALKIGENFELRRDILDFLLNSVRNPFVFASDLKARLGTCMRIRERLLREVERRSPQAVAGGLRRIISLSGSLARARLREVNDGIYRSILFLDSVGTDVGLVRVPTTAIKEEDSLTVVVQGVSPENGMGPMHSTWHLTKAALGVYLFGHLFRGLPPNIGLFEPITILVEGPSVANCSDEVAHGEGTSIASAVVQNLHVIGSKMLFGSLYREAVSAPFGRNEQLLIFAGVNPFGYQTANFTGVQNAAGQGARFDMDGEDGMGFFWGPLTDAGESEEMDVRLPPFTLSRVVDTNYHGFGKYRGGAPITEVSMVVGPHRCLVTGRGCADKVSQDPGLFGGYAGPPNPRFIIRGTDVLERLRDGDTSLVFRQHDLATRKPLSGEYVFEPTGMPTETYTEGDLFVHSVGAGGGYGDVLERDPGQVMKDLQEGLITAEVVRKIYRVVFDEQKLQPDDAATLQEREAERKARIARGKPFVEFMVEWLGKKPKTDILKYYGHWPEPRIEEYRKPFWGIYLETHEQLARRH
jgi:acetophenone carboxylase